MADSWVEWRGLASRWWHRLGSPRWFYESTGRWVPWLGALAAVLLLTGTIWGLGFAPADYQQGNSFRIIYIHVPAAVLAQSCYVLIATAGVVLLVWRMKLADMVMAAAAPIGAWMTFLALATGAIWGKPTWGAWWVWDARVTSMTLLLFLYFGLIGLRQAILRPEAAGRACAVLAIVGVVNIPIIKYSVDWWLTLHQPSTFKLTERPAMPASMYLPLLANVLGFYVLFAVNLIQRTRVEILERERRTQWVANLVSGRPLQAGGEAGGHAGEAGREEMQR